MKIALRTSGGRGEYELAGRHAEIHAADLFGRTLEFEVTPDLVVPGHATARLLQGKPRIRLDKGGNPSHPALVLAATLLLPRPIRELRKTGDSSLVLQDGRYAVSGIDVDVVKVGADAAQVRPTTVWVRNFGDSKQRIEFASRMALIARLWTIATTAASPMAVLLQQHHDAVNAGDHEGIQRAAARIQRQVGAETDVLPALLATFGLLEDQEPGEGVDVGVGQGGASEGGEDDDTTPLQATRREIIQWRKQAARGSQGRKFSASVKAAYGHQCIFSGSRLPKTSETPSSGVDAAHILPWTLYELNSVSNGLCLNKLCHWAFDAGVLRLDFQHSDKQYRLSVPASVRRAAAEVSFDLDYFLALEGPVRNERLPSDKTHWPSQKYLAALNQRMFPA